MAKSSWKRRSSTQQQTPFTRGCCLSGCLCYLGCCSLLIIAGSLLLITAVAHYFHHLAPNLAAIGTQLNSFLLLNSAPVIGVTIGLVEFLQIRAVWRGYRWGIYGLFGIVVSELACACWGEKSLTGLVHGAMSTASNNIPLLILFLLIRPKWNAMR